MGHQQRGDHARQIELEFNQNSGCAKGLLHQSDRAAVGQELKALDVQRGAAGQRSGCHVVTRSRQGEAR